MTENERFNLILNHFLSEKIISYEKDLAKYISAKPERIRYLKTRGSLTNDEIELLSEAFSNINWWWVKSGQGNMLLEDPEVTKTKLMVEEADPIYKAARPEYKEALAGILLGTSDLPIEEREAILIKEVIILQQTLLDQIHMNTKPLGLFTKRKKKTH